MTTQEYEAALSFAGEQREYVRRVAAALDAAKVTYFFDERAAAGMWGEDLVEYLDRVYRQGSRFVVVFVSSAYATKVWPRVEFRSALAHAIEVKGAYILPVRFDDTALPGLLPTVAYLDARRLGPEEIAQSLLEKLGHVVPQLPGPSYRQPRVPPNDFNPYAETQRALLEIREILSRRSQLLPPGLVGHAEERGGRFLLRILRSGTPLYSLDIFLGGGFGDNTLCFYGRTGGGFDSEGSSNAFGIVEWDRDRGLIVVKLSNMSLLPDMARDYRLTSSELADAIWNEACERVEGQL